jgi:hypothetical protein
MVKPLNINSTTPVSLCIKELFNRSQHIRFKKSALVYQVNSAIDHASGASKNDIATGQHFGFDTSKTSHHGLIRIRDKNTRILSDTATIQETGEAPPFDSFNWRTIIAFRFPFDLNVESIEGYVPGLGWQTVNFHNRRLWCSAPQDEERIAEFNDLKRRLEQVRYERELVKKARDNGKKKIPNGHTGIVGKWNDRMYLYEQKSGTTDKLFDKTTNEEVKKVRNLQPQKDIALVTNFELNPVNVPKPESIDDIGSLAARFEVLGETEKHLCKAVRETELGLIEDYMIGINTDTLDDIDGQTIMYGGIAYKIVISDDSSYDYPDGTVERWKSGELEMRTVETKAQWRAKEIANGVTKTELEEVNA